MCGTTVQADKVLDGQYRQAGHIVLFSRFNAWPQKKSIFTVLRSPVALCPAEQFFCNWVLLPDYSDVTISVNYSMMLPGEELWVYAEGDEEPTMLRHGDGLGGFLTRFLTVKTMGIQFQFTPARNSDFAGAIRDRGTAPYIIFAYSYLCPGSATLNLKAFRACRLSQSKR